MKTPPRHEVGDYSWEWDFCTLAALINDYHSVEKVVLNIYYKAVFLFV
jgi:hypothetical protein